MRKMLIRLFLVCLVFIAVKNGFSDVRSDVENIMRQVQLVFSGAKKLVYPEDEKNWIQVLDGEGNLLGRMVLSSPFADHITGYGGPIPLFMATDGEGKVMAVVLFEHSETSAFIKKMESEGFFSRFKDIFWKDLAKKKYDAVTGATMTSIAVIQTLQTRLKLIPDIDSKTP